MVYSIYISSNVKAKLENMTQIYKVCSPSILLQVKSEMTIAYLILMILLSIVTNKPSLKSYMLIVYST